MTAITMAGLEGVLADELRKLGAMEVKEAVRSVTFRGDKGFMYTLMALITQVIRCKL